MTTANETLTIPLNKLEAWKGNVRKTEPKAALTELAASIESHGLLQSLVVQKNGNGMYQVIAGRRRFMALQSLQKAGSIKATFPVACGVMDADANPSELSLAENFQREQMHPADEFEAFAKLHKGGMSAAEIAERNGITEVHVEKRLKLANVAPSLIKQYRDGGLTLNHMMAFAVTTDHDAQERVWRDMPTYRKRDPEALRDMLTQGDIDASDRRVKFVGLAAYEKAGGQIRRDLFASDEDGAFIIDKELLAKLVADKLERVAAGVRKEGWKWVEVREQMDHSEWSRFSRQYAQASRLPPKEQEKLNALNAEFEKLSEADDGEDENPALDALQAKIDKIEDRPRAWQPDTLLLAGAVVTVGHNGKSEIERGLVRPEDKPKQTKTVTRQNESGETVQEQVEDKSALSAALTEALTTQRTSALMAVLQNKPSESLRVLVHSLASNLFYNGSNQESVIKISLHKTYPQEIEGTPAHKSLEAAEDKWKKTLPSKEEELWDWCFKQKDGALLELLAFCVSRSVDAIQRKHEKSDAARFEEANKLASAIGLDMNDWFQASAENYFSRVSKPLIMQAFSESKIEITPNVEKMKKGDLAAMAERDVGRTKWLPELLRGPTSG